MVTMKKFQDICGGQEEASVILRYLSGCRTAQYLSVNKKDFVEVTEVIIPIKKNAIREDFSLYM